MEQIILIAQQLSQEGKVPNTALIKARLPKNVPLPTIIEGLKLWQKNPQQEANAQRDENLQEPKEASLNSELEALIEAKIEQALAPLHAEIKALKLALSQRQADKN